MSQSVETPQRETQDLTVHDLVGVGVGPFNLGLAALLEPLELDALFLDEKPRFEWHPGLLLEETTLQVPFLADLVTMADPTSRYSFLNYLREYSRLYNFYFLERFHIPRREYNHYCQWVAEELASCRFGERVEEVRLAASRVPGAERVFEVRTLERATGATRTYRARNLALGVGSAPHVPECFVGLPGEAREDIFHSAEFADRRDRLRAARSVTVVGSGQSAAEVFYELLKEQPEYGYRLDWLTRSRGFFPMEYSRLGLEHFSPDYTRYFYELPLEQRDRTRSRQDLLYKGIDEATISAIYDLLYERTVGGERLPANLQPLIEIAAVTPEADGYRLTGRQLEQERSLEHHSECVVLATGYHRPLPDLLNGLRDEIRWDAKGRYEVELDYRLATATELPGSIFVQNGEMHTHGVGAPDLGLGAHRNAVIVNTLTGRAVYSVREKNVFQQFGVAESGAEYSVRQEVG